MCDIGGLEIPQRSTPLCAIPYSEAREALGNETARIHHAARRRGGRVAARGACAQLNLAEIRMANSKLIRTYIYIGLAIMCFVGAVALGINLLTEPEINRGDVGALIAALGALLTASSLLWIRYGHKPPTR